MKSTIVERIAVIFLLAGVLSLLFSVLYELQVLALVGLGLTFWGALFLILRPTRYVEGALLSGCVIPSYSTIDRILREIPHGENAYYIPPYPKDVYLPQHLKGLKDAVVFIPANGQSKTPSIEEIVERGFRTKNPKGIVINSPGADLLRQIEKAANVDLTKISVEQLYEVISRSISENLNLAKEVTITSDGNKIHLRFFDSLFKNLYSSELGLKSVHALGCPITSAVACAIAKSTGKPVKIDKQKVSSDGMAIEVWFNTVQEQTQ